jgi:hypothetical protein
MTSFLASSLFILRFIKVVYQITTVIYTQLRNKRIKVKTILGRSVERAVTSI